MAGLEQFSVNEMLPRSARTVSQPAVTPRDRREPAPAAEDQAAVSFSHLLVERQKRPDSALDVSAKKGGAAEPTAVPADKPVAPAKPAGGKGDPAVATPTELIGSAPSLPGTGIGAAPAAGTGEARPGTPALDGVLKGGEPDSVPATTAPANPSAGNPAPDPSGQAASPSGLAPTIETPAAQAAPKEALLPASAASVDGSGRPAPLPAPASAVALDSAAKAQETYAKAPVVSESQLLADSLKQEGAAASSRTGTPSVSPAATGQATTAVPAATAAGPGDLLLNTPDPAAAPATEEAVPAAVDLPPESAEADVEVTADTAPADTAALPQPESESLTAAVTESSEASAAAATAPASADTGDVTADAAPGAALDPAAARVQEAATQKSTATAVGQPSTSRQIHRQVVSQFASRLTDITGGEQVTIKLNPESLGQIELNFESREDRLSVVITASSTEADAAVRENLKDLTDRIVERSARFSHVDVRVEVRDGNEARQDGKPDQRQEGRQDQRRGQNGQDQREGQNEQDRQQGQQPHAAQQSWENAMSWQLADEARSEEG